MAKNRVLHEVDPYHIIWYKKIIPLESLCMLSIITSGSVYKNKYENNSIKLKDEVGMAGPKNTQTRFVGISVSSRTEFKQGG